MMAKPNNNRMKIPSTAKVQVFSDLFVYPSASSSSSFLIADACWNISFDKPFDDPLLEPVPIAPNVIIAVDRNPPPSDGLQMILNRALYQLGDCAVGGDCCASANDTTTTDFIDDIEQIEQIVWDPETPPNETSNNKRKATADHHGSKKRRKAKNAISSSSPRLRPYHETKWDKQYIALCDFSERNGHCNVPHTGDKSTAHSIALARWVKRQRYQYKLLQQGMPLSTMTQERIDKLEAIQFTWDIHTAVWEERLAELAKYKKKQGHCNVPSGYEENPTLATWVKCQRRQYNKKKMLGKTSNNISDDRIAALERLGFAWEMHGIRRR